MLKYSKDQWGGIVILSWLVILYNCTTHLDLSTEEWCTDTIRIYMSRLFASIWTDDKWVVSSPFIPDSFDTIDLLRPNRMTPSDKRPLQTTTLTHTLRKQNVPSFSPPTTTGMSETCWTETAFCDPLNLPSLFLFYDIYWNWKPWNLRKLHCLMHTV